MNSRSKQTKSSVNIFSKFFNLYIGVMIVSLGGIEAYVVYFYVGDLHGLHVGKKVISTKFYCWKMPSKHLPVQS